MNLHKIQNIVTEGEWGRMGLSPGFSDRSHLPLLNDGSMKNEWWFSIIDVIEILTGNDRPRKYWSDLKKRLISEGYSEVSEKIGQLKMIAPDRKMLVSDTCIELDRRGFVVLNIDAIGRWDEYRKRMTGTHDIEKAWMGTSQTRRAIPEPNPRNGGQTARGIIASSRSAC